MITIMSTQLQSLFDGLRGQEFSFLAGQHVFQATDPVRLIHLVRSGSIFLTRRQRDGAALVLQRASAGSVLAEASVYSDRYHCAAEAQSHAVTWGVPRRDFRKRITTDGTYANAWATHLAQEVQRARLQAEIVSLRTVAARVSAWLSWNRQLPPKGE